jgi:hypothetical protein
MAEEEEEEFDLNCDEVLSDPEPEYDMHPMNGHVMTDPMLTLRAELAWCVVGCFAPNPLTAAYTSAYTVVHSVGTSSMHAARRSLLIYGCLTATAASTSVSAGDRTRPR